MDIISCPDYIPLNVISEKKLSHKWDAWDPYETLGDRNEETMEQLSRVSNRAIIAYAIACSEWVIFRLSKQFETSVPYKFIQACWAFEMEKSYRAPPPLKEKDWEGPIFGAIDLALVTILNTYYVTEEEAAETEAAIGELIALHVLEDKAQFISWREKVLDKLIYYFPRSSSDPWGEAVPREALDPKLTLDLEQRDMAVSRFLSSLDVKLNNFLKFIPGGDNTQ